MDSVKTKKPKATQSVRFIAAETVIDELRQVQVIGIDARGQIVASAAITHWEKPLVGLCGVHVDPNHRRRGIGRRLLAFVIQHCARFKKSNVWLNVKAQNKAAIDMYTKANFQPVMQFDNDIYMSRPVKR